MSKPIIMEQPTSDKNNKFLRIKKILLPKKIKFNPIKRSNLVIVIGGDVFLCFQINLKKYKFISLILWD